MPRLIDLKCPRCGAQLPPREASGTYRCEFCQHTFAAKDTRIDAPNPYAPQAPNPFGAPPNPYAQPPQQYPINPYPQPRFDGYPPMVQVRTGAGALIGVAIAVIAMGIVGAVVAVAARGGFKGKDRVSLAWTRDAVIPTEIGGSESYVALISTLDDDQQMYVVGRTTGKDKELWRYGPLGSSSSAGSATHMAALKKYLVVADYKRKVHVIDLETGKQRDAYDISDKAKGVCATADLGTAFVDVSDGSAVTIDSKGKLHKNAKRPDDCLFGDASWSDGYEWLSSELGTQGMSLDHVLVQGKYGVAAGTKTPGTAYPLLVSFDPKSHKIFWKEKFPRLSIDDVSPASPGSPFGIDDLQHGIYAGQYETNEGAYRVAVWDLGKDELLIDVPYDKTQSIESIRLSKDYVYIGGTNGLHVVDLSSGEVVESYAVVF